MNESLISALLSNEDAIVARGEGEPVLARELLRRAGAIAAILPDATPGSEVAFSFARDRVACAAALLGTWTKGHTAVVPENGSREVIVPLLQRASNVAFLHDTGVGLGTHVPTLLSKGETAQPLSWARTDPDSCVLAAYLQPASGSAEASQWTCAELLRELTALAEQMDVPGGAHVLSSLTPTALPGLFLGLLVPLLRGASFEAEKARGDEGLAKRVHDAHSLIATPAHVRALARLSGDALAELSTLHVVDEGIDSLTASLFEERHAVRCAGTAELALDREEPSWAAAVRETLFSLPTVTDVCVDWLASMHAFVTVVGSDNRSTEYRELVRKQVPSEFTLNFSVRAELPRDENGRLADRKHRLMYRFGYTGSELNPDLEWRELNDSVPERRVFKARLPENYAFFEGHYASYSVLAGAVQLHELVLPCLRRIEPKLRPIKRLSSLKFMSRIGPRDEVAVVIERRPNANDVRFEIHVADERCSAGLIQLAPTSEGASQ